VARRVDDPHTAADGSVRLYIRDYRHPEVLERKLAGVGVPAVVDFVPNGKRCDRLGGAVTPERGDLTEPGGGRDDGYVRLHPDKIGKGRTLVITVMYVKWDKETHVGTFAAGTAKAGTARHCTLVDAPPAIRRDAQGGVGG
jgi:hypothetical protein